MIAIRYTHAHTHVDTKWFIHDCLLAYSTLNAHERDEGTKRSGKAPNDNGFHFQLSCTQIQTIIMHNK